ncbi:hypothetical protein OH491_03615 [Termitidicoccus mucosus]
MSKPLKLVLILSIAINAIWLIGAAAGWFSIGTAKASGNVGQSGNGGGGDSTLAPETAKGMVALLSTSDAAALRDQLRALGLPSDVVREIVSARIRSGYETRRRAIRESAQQAAAQQPYWRSKISHSYIGLTAEQLSEMTSLYREERSQITQIMGSDGEVPSQAQIIFSFLPPDKAQQFSDMEGDYHAMRQQILQEMSGFRMSGDNAKLKLLDDEYMRDVAAFLTPDEKMENSLRNSFAARQLQYAFSDFNGTEDEYKTIFALQNGMNEKYLINSIYGNPDDSGLSKSEREAAQKEVDARIKATLGDERYADYLRAQRGDYKSLQAAARRFNLSADTVAQTYQMRDNAATEAARISDDTSLSTEQKNAAYTALTEQTTGQIRATLGDDIGDAYINNALAWLKNLPKGGNVKINPAGNVKVTQPKQ